MRSTAERRPQLGLGGDGGVLGVVLSGAAEAGASLGFAVAPFVVVAALEVEVVEAADLPELVALGGDELVVLHAASAATAAAIAASFR